jgi:hypothetical protein
MRRARAKIQAEAVMIQKKKKGRGSDARGCDGPTPITYKYLINY